MLDFEKDEDRFCIHFGDLQLSFYFEDGIESLNYATKSFDTIQHFLKDSVEGEDSAYCLSQNGMHGSYIDLSFDDNDDIHLRVTTVCIDYWYDIDIAGLDRVKNFLREFITIQENLFKNRKS